eukprot:7170880-Prymnesium_polylepis.1
MAATNVEGGEKKKRVNYRRLAKPKNVVSHRLRDRLVKIKQMAHMAELPLANTVSAAEEGEHISDKVQIERDAQIQLDRVLEARCKTMRGIVAQHARDYNAIRLRGDKRYAEAQRLQLQ